MSKPLGADPLRATREEFAALLREKELRDERRRQADLGEKGRLGGLIHFVRYFWHILEPNTPLVEGMPMYAIILHLEAVTRGEIKRLCINVSPGNAKSLLVNCFWPAWEWSAAGMPWLRYVTFAYAAHLTERDNQRFRDVIRSPDFQEMWGDGFKMISDGVVKPTNNKTGWKFSSSIKGVGTGERGNRILCDDVHSVKEAESEAVRTETVRWAKESMSNRLNDMREDVIILIGQRVHEEDVSASLLKGGEYVHLAIPNEFDDRYVCETEWWSDPRDERGELAWPERFPQEVVGQIKQTLGPYAYCTPAESPVLMGDLSMRPIGEVAVGDTVIGFTTDQEPHAPEFKYKRRRLVTAKVVSISKSVRPVVKITMDSGKTIRCTADHKWFTGREPPRPIYMPAAVGRRLMRVCDPDIPQLTKEDDLRAAGWLAGFFDGEGSAVMMKKHAHYPPSCLISFAQGAGRNAPICDRLEKTLEQLGFDYGYQERPREQGHVVRWYYLRNNNRALPMFQKFLHVVKPTKWRERMMEGALGTKFIVGQEKVVSIEPDGEETVYGLETTTGNYVVWGFASSNSAQYQQMPEPRGGGILKRDWWGEYMWPKGESFRHKIDLLIGSLDPAFTSKQENDPSALTIWGIYKDRGQPKIIAIHAWQRWLEMNGRMPERQPHETNKQYEARSAKDWGLVQWVKYDCERLNVKLLLVENKASGHTVAQELRRQYGDTKFGTLLVDPGTQDKRARAYSVQHVLSAGLVSAPCEEKDGMVLFRDWAQMLIDECAKFRGLAGEEDNLVDSATQAWRWLRDNGWLVLEDERRAREEYMATHRSKKEPVYDV